MNENQLTREKFVAVMESAGIGKDLQHRFHAAFEKNYPEEHHQFLLFLQIPEDQISGIHRKSR